MNAGAGHIPFWAKGLLIHTPLQRGDRARPGPANRFSGFSSLRLAPALDKPLKRFHSATYAPDTPLKRGVNDTGPAANVWTTYTTEAPRRGSARPTV